MSVKSSTISFTVTNNGSDKVKDIEISLNGFDRTDEFDIKQSGDDFECTAKKADLNLKDGTEYTVTVEVQTK